MNKNANKISPVDTERVFCSYQFRFDMKRILRGNTEYVRTLLKLFEKKKKNTNKI